MVTVNITRKIQVVAICLLEDLFHFLKLGWRRGPIGFLLVYSLQIVGEQCGCNNTLFL